MNNRDSQQFLEQADIDFLFDQHDTDEYGSNNFSYFSAAGRTEPSLAIILMSAACGLAGGIFGLYIAYIVLDLSVQISAAVATLCLSAALGITGSGLTVLTGSRAATANIALSCGLILLATVLFGFCTLAGALAATLVLTTGG